MKFPLSITALILTVAASLGWRNHTVLAALRVEHEQALVRARDAGLPLDGGPFKRSSGKNRESQAARAASFEELARSLVEVRRQSLEAFSNNSKPSIELANLRYQVIETLFRLNKAEAGLLLEHLRMLDDGGDPNASHHASNVISSLSFSRPAEAIDLAKEMAIRFPDAADTLQMAARVSFEHWAKRDPLAALDWLRNNTSSDPDLITPELKREVIGPLACIDPRLAFRLADEFGLPVDETFAGEIGASAKTQEERERVLASMRGFIGTLSDNEVRSGFSNSLVAAMFEKARDQGFEHAIQMLEQQDLPSAALSVLLSDLPPRSDDTARWLEWMGTRFPEESKQSAGRLMKSWTQTDYPAATAWLESAPESPMRRQATVTYAETVAPYHPAEAARWALTLEQGDERVRLFEKIHGAWKKKDEAAAAAFARQQGIEE